MPDENDPDLTGIPADGRKTFPPPDRLYVVIDRDCYVHATSRGAGDFASYPPDEFRVFEYAVVRQVKVTTTTTIETVSPTPG